VNESWKELMSEMNYSQNTDPFAKRVESFYRFLTKNKWKFIFKENHCLIYSLDGMTEVAVDRIVLTAGSDFFFVEIMYEIKKSLSERGFSPVCHQIKVRQLTA
jgi:hypothetical protein